MKWDRTVVELAQEASTCQVQVKTLTERQEMLLVSDTSLLLTAVCALNHWRIQDIVDTYQMTEAECLQSLLQLDRIGLIEFLPGNRIRLKVARDFDWLPNGPIKHFFRTQEKDFLDSHFEGTDGAMSFVHGMFTEDAITQLSKEVKRFRRRFAELHEESLPTPLSRKHGISSLLVTRHGWEPAAFLALRRIANMP